MKRILAIVYKGRAKLDDNTNCFIYFGSILELPADIYKVPSGMLLIDGAIHKVEKYKKYPAFIDLLQRAYKLSKKAETFCLADLFEKAHLRKKKKTHGKDNFVLFV